MAEYACTRCGSTDMARLGLSRVCLDAEACHGRQCAQLRDRAEQAEAKLAEVRGVLLEGGQGDATARCRAIAITGTGEETRRG